MVVAMQIGKSLMLGRTARLLGAIALPAALAAAACDQVPLTAPNGSSITVTAPTRTLPLGGTTQIQAFVLEQAGTTVQNGTTVMFTSTLGRVDPPTALTTNGIAVTTFHAGNESGTAEIRATSGAAGGGTSTPSTPTTPGTTPPATTGGTGNAVTISIGAANAAGLTLSAAPTTLPAGGGSSVISAAVVDGSGNRILGIPVVFSASAGTLSAPSAVTDENGVARVTLTFAQAESTVTARVGSGEGARTGTITIRSALPNSIQLSINPVSPNAGQPMTLTVSVTVGTNNIAPNVTIEWGDGVTENIGAVNGTRTVSHTYLDPGSFTIRATGRADQEVTSTSIGVIVGQRAAVAVTVAPLTGTANLTTFVFTITPAVGVTPRDIVIDFGERNVTRTFTSGQIAGTITATMVYQTAGTKTITVTQNNVDGTSSTDAVVVTVTAAPTTPTP